MDFLELKNKKWYIVFVHVLGWLILLAIPYLLTYNSRIRAMEFAWMPVIFYAIFFYFNYLFAIDRLFFQKKWLQFILWNLVIIIVSAWMIHQLRFNVLQVHTTVNFPGPRRAPIRFFIYKDALSLFIPLTIALVLKFSQRWSQIEKQRVKQQSERLSSELQQLKYQLHPHFFFNSLNNIHSLVERSPAIAKEAIHSLSKLMRYILYDSETENVTIGQELEFLNKYIDLMRLRLTPKNNVLVDFKISPTVANYRIEPLLFISLIENAFKHGICGKGFSVIRFHMYCEDESELVFISENTSFPKNESDKSGSGIGLVNVLKRLDLLYGTNYTYEAGTQDQMYRAVLKIKINSVKKQE